MEIKLGECWKFMKDDFMSFFEFYDNGKLVRGLNSAFIALILKSDNLVSLAEYRPISLIGSVCKILAKVLSNRLKSVMPHIIGVEQSAFIGGRTIQGSVLSHRK